MDPLTAAEYIQRFLKIRTKSGQILPFRLNAAQQRLYAAALRQHRAGRPIRLLVLKARQLGFSTLTEALIFHGCATRRNVNALIVAHREDATDNLFRMSRLFYEELPAPVKPRLKTGNAREMVFDTPSRSGEPGLRSRLKCATAGGQGIGRSDTLQYVHLSEYAFWPEGSEGKAATLAGILQAVPSLPGTMVVIESTANGYEDFKARWDAAVAGENDFEPVFFPWFDCPEYVMPVPPGTVWLPEELALMKRFGLSGEQLQWRRWCIANNCGGDREMFRQEYPATPEEAFRHSGTGVFPNAAIDERLAALAPPLRRGRFENGTFADDPLGEVRIYAEPVPGRPYVLGGDTAGDGSDFFTALVLDNTTGEQVASLRRSCSEPEYVRQVQALGLYYNGALAAIETNFSTYPVLKLAELDYPLQYLRQREDSLTLRPRQAFGFRTDRLSRPRIIAGLVEVFAAAPELFRDEVLLREMLTFCYNEDHRPEALAGHHDDMVMAAAIAYAARSQQRCTDSPAPVPRRKRLPELPQYRALKHARR